jgi:hypothetical protein
MASNNFAAKTNAELVAIAQQANAAIVAGGDPGYGVPAAQLTALTTSTTALDAGITAVTAARAASKAATEQQEAAREEILAALSAIGDTIYINPDVTPQMIAEAGYAVHDQQKTKHFPTQATGLTATPDATGTVLFTWGANGNVYGVTYVIEGRASESDPWSFVATTTRLRLSVPGFTPGATHWFRVTASHNGQSSAPSAPVAIWGPEQVVPLQVAA